MNRREVYEIVRTIKLKLYRLSSDGKDHVIKVGPRLWIELDQIRVERNSYIGARAAADVAQLTIMGVPVEACPELGDWGALVESLETST